MFLISYINKKITKKDLILKRILELKYLHENAFVATKSDLYKNLRNIYICSDNILFIIILYSSDILPPIT